MVLSGTCDDLLLAADLPPELNDTVRFRDEVATGMDMMGLIFFLRLQPALTEPCVSQSDDDKRPGLLCKDAHFVRRCTYYTDANRMEKKGPR